MHNRELASGQTNTPAGRQPCARNCPNPRGWTCGNGRHSPGVNRAANYHTVSEHVDLLT